MHYPAAAQFLRNAVPDVIHAYQMALRRVRSPLAIRKEVWPKCRDQARAIVEDCVARLNGDGPLEAAEAWRYSHLVGTDRAAQGIAVAESVRAVEILWNAMQPTIHSAVQHEAPARRAPALLLISAAFRSSAGTRLYAGAVGYGGATAQASDTLPNDDDVVAAGVSEAAPMHAVVGVALSRREKEVLEGVAKAMTNSQIARQLGITTATVKRHLNNIYGKLGAVSRIDAVNKVFGRY
ncbi:helix-turn-helix transcriptional regulator [Streptomyces sp. B-S-A8]|uniref:Helix-turn-helix transcriptional regulator n=1 Tax=Streptomyces solicavernae TaxID=3043614 RepID=A0ABT6S1F0_9ACTN|nr:helix-turn-helix transcriptional regulator [Streptomyces sp. B-S-A8]MDI3389798.1 helix-turn-helix transcriptional regulator [Streptomyces sp. B-S-A8]